MASMLPVYGVRGREAEIRVSSEELDRMFPGSILLPDPLAAPLPGADPVVEDAAGILEATLLDRLRLDIVNELARMHGPTHCPAGGASAGSSCDFFGDGSDGDVILYADTTLSRDTFYNSLTIRAGVTLNPNGFIVYVRKTLAILGDGKISASGGAGGAGSGAAGGAAGVVGGASSIRPWLGTAAAGGAGGTSGGAGTTAGTGGAGGTGKTRVALIGPLVLLAGCGGGGGGYLGASGGATNAAAGGSGLGASGAAGGAAVFSSGTPSLGGGGGGGAGGVVLVYARVVDNAGAIRADGGAGGAGQTSGGNKSGNGGGGAGGSVVLYYTLPSGSGVGTLSAAAGAAGSGGNGGAAGAAGTTASTQVSV